MIPAGRESDREDKKFALLACKANFFRTFFIIYGLGAYCKPHFNFSNSDGNIMLYRSYSICILLSVNIEQSLVLLPL